MNHPLRIAAVLAAFVLLLAPGALAQEFCPVEPAGLGVTANPAFRLQGNTVIPVVFHVITNAAGEGEVTLDQIEAQIAVLNAAFNLLCPMCNGGGFSFELLGVSRVTNDDWFEDMDYAPPTGTADDEVKQALSVDPAHVLNVYTADLEQDPLGYSTYAFPFTYPGNVYVDTEDSFWHGIVLDYRVLPGGGATGRDLGVSSSTRPATTSASTTRSTAPAPAIPRRHATRLATSSAIPRSTAYRTRSASRTTRSVTTGRTPSRTT